MRCAPLWHDPLLAHAGRDALIVLVGQYAHAYYLGSERKRSLAETVRAYANYLPRYFPLPHPSWRSKIWMAKNPWFSRNLLPRLRKKIGTRLGAGGS